MDAAGAHARKDDVLFLDVRERYEWDAGHIEGSIHIPIMELPKRVDELPKDATIVCVCQIGQRSELAARFLKENGYDAHNLERGVAAWQSSGFVLVGEGEIGAPGEVIDGYAAGLDGPL